MGHIAINLVMALLAEAKPVARHFGLQRDSRATEFPLYRNGDMALAVSGPGQIAAQRATEWLGSLERNQAIWINLGIAGHPTRPVGQAVLADCVEDDATGEQWHTMPLPAPPCAIDRVVTLNHPDLNYRREALVEMEAAGFFRAARVLAAPGRIYCLKIVSDNRQHLVHEINGKRVSQLLEQGMTTLESLLQQARNNS